jgi:hypothetical protein
MVAIRPGSGAITTTRASRTSQVSSSPTVETRLMTSSKAPSASVSIWNGRVPLSRVARCRAS